VSARRDAREAERADRRRQMARDIGLDPGKLCHCVQVHDRRIAVIDAPRPSGPLEGVDAVATALPGVPLMSFSADCPLVLACDPVRGAIGLAHASWRCTVAGLTEKLVQTMVERFGCAAGDMLAGVGPGAGPPCPITRPSLQPARDAYTSTSGVRTPRSWRGPASARKTSRSPRFARSAATTCSTRFGAKAPAAAISA
jgi:hypothetical protein